MFHTKGLQRIKSDQEVVPPLPRAFYYLVEVKHSGVNRLSRREGFEQSITRKRREGHVFAS
jgi:hypothetical protein